MVKLTIAHDDYFKNMIEIFDSVNENRQLKGVRYPCGIILYALFLAECAQQFSQRNKQIWISLNWMLVIFFGINIPQINVIG